MTQPETVTSETRRPSSAIAGVITGLSVAHERASVGTIEAVAPGDPRNAMVRLLEHDEVREALVVTTCNRVEWYVVAETAADARKVLDRTVPGAAASAGRWLGHEAVIEHLLRVAAGLESMVIGEDEILGQLRSVCSDAEAVGALGPLLEETVWKAIHFGERVRTETRINEGITSLGRAAVARAGKQVDLGGSNALVVGAGDMARIAANAFADAGVAHLTLVNRTPNNAQAIAEEIPIDVEVGDFGVLDRALDRADVAITATGSSTPIVDGSILAGAGPTVIVDLGQPRDVTPDAGTGSPVTYYDLDDVRAVTQESNDNRRAAASVASDMAIGEAAKLQDRLKRQQADDVIGAMYAGAEEIKQRELAEAERRLAAGDEPEAVVGDFADALVGHLLAAPTKGLRDAAGADDWETIQTALHLFDPAFPDGRVVASDAAGSMEDGIGSSSQR